MRERTKHRIKRTSVDEMLREFEAKYGMSSADFYARFQAGEFPDDGSDEFMDHMTWAGLYESLSSSESQRLTR